jgi:hypothetical protein
VTDSTGTTRLPALRASAIVREALATYRANAVRVASAAIVLLAPLNLLANATATQFDSGADRFDAADGGRIALALMGGLVASLGAIGFAGVLDQLVAEQRRGLAKQSLASVVRDLPYGRLLLASVLLAVAMVAGLLLLILPGLFAFTAFVLAGPLIGSGESVVGSFRRSARLVVPHFWLVAGVVTLPMLVSVFVDDALSAVLERESELIEVLTINGVVAATFGAVIALIQVVLTEELLERDGTIKQPEPAPMIDTSA